jgi:hypothetical protein
LQKRYNGYLFARNGNTVYNPFSLLNTLKKQDFMYYWFETGTPTFLVKALADMQYDLLSLKDNVHINANAVMDYRFNNRDIVPPSTRAVILPSKATTTTCRNTPWAFPTAKWNTVS